MEVYSRLENESLSHFCQEFGYAYAAAGASVISTNQSLIYKRSGYPYLPLLLRISSWLAEWNELVQTDMLWTFF